MTQVTVKQLAQVVDTPVERLLQQMREAGLSHTSAEQVVTDNEKQALLAHLKSSHGAKVDEPRKITLQRKTTTKLKVGGSKTISVEVRKKKTFVKRSPDEIEAEKQRELEEQRAAEEAARQKAAEEARQQAEEEARRQAEAAKTQAPAAASPEPVAAVSADPAPVVAPVAPPVEERKKDEPRRPDKARSDDDERRDRKQAQHRPSLKAKAPLSRTARSGEDDADGFRRGGRGKSKLKKRNAHGFQSPTGPIVREVAIGETITVGDLAQQMSVKAAEVIKFMFKMGTPVTINQVLDQETAQLIAEELGHKVKLVSDNALEEQLAELLKFEGEAITRAPVVTVMGHVDHGKTSLLDYIRRAKVAAGEAGGITQHIGAYHVETDRGMVTFLDTPGHAAFTAMRARGAQATDIVILVVAADDGVMPQTIEAIQHAKAAGVPLVVAVNKIDKPGADLDRIRSELSVHEVTSEEWGGDTPFVSVSAKMGTGVDDLLEAVLLQAEILELTATPSAPGRGVVVESRLDKGRGPVATVLVQDGTLRQGDMALVGSNYGRIRAMLDENGKPIKEAGPSIPVEILGLDGTPDAGDELSVLADEKKAREVALFRQGKFREVKLARAHAGKLENIFENMGQEEKKTLNIVLKSDVRGSLEALQGSLSGLGNDEVQVRVIGGGVGGITESDANLALASNAVLFGFNVRADAGARKIVEQEGLDLRYYNVIYDIIEDVKKALTGMLGSDVRENILGIAEVRDVFRSPKFGAVAGCMVTEGMVHRNRPIRVLRDDVVIFEGELESLRRFKDDVAEVRAGMECGIAVKSYNDVKAGDKIEVFEKVEVARSL
ncbi:MAG: translation initiation factor IF-2 [Pseudomonas sp.]|mgnify:CR=1 FL=1|jgi:translation initiation factor IF-2|uniref:translation initiation factor IF-2 n=1 Tax=Stutzerimonas xanthomarina TaxID=271420 RepID=UPI000C4C4807|nr:translation initiation factor IF-2 [Stutzerimonas xanthomarina]MAX93203.1 translation initiation factor IF-2 [Pseudomonas sp.]MBU0812464.1 translation initiation factor IF-2 [Gammaproteobacteria bacterium]MBK3847775.1 translation initiation factor IF-2 [Stutzerimonas xanthomarina]MBU0854503.1 translation initiation factor IF-2 [Gammaproteobacteria bacterium]MBU1300398.1 translation initiation factor IF-2 [Gammaproteobacteria bacterium]|tara:strand:- start:474 stop:2975 length:2502 start_codon:yes stop_codon:yes gene_type:complete